MKDQSDRPIGFVMVKIPEGPGTQCAPIEIIATVRGDCGIIHAGIKEWQDCAACDAILKYRLRVL